MSADLQWELIKKSNRFLVKRDGSQFSSEPYNLKNINSYKFSGLANPRALDVSVSKDGKSVQLSMKKTGNGAVRKPKTAPVQLALKKGVHHGVNYSSELVRHVTERASYRADLSRVAIARQAAL